MYKISIFDQNMRLYDMGSKMIVGVPKAFYHHKFNTECLWDLDYTFVRFFHDFGHFRPTKLELVLKNEKTFFLIFINNCWFPASGWFGRTNNGHKWPRSMILSTKKLKISLCDKNWRRYPYICTCQFWPIMYRSGNKRCHPLKYFLGFFFPRRY